MSFGDVSTAAGLQKLDSFLLDKAYVAGWVPSQEDVKIFQTIKSSPDGKSFIFRFKLYWINYKNLKKSFELGPKDKSDEKLKLILENRYFNSNQKEIE